MLLYLKRIFVIDEIAAFEVLNERGEIWIFDIFYSIQYLSVPIFLAWKWSWTTTALWIGCFMFGYRILFSDLWKLTMLAEVLFFVPEVLKIFWFLFISTDPSYSQYQAFYPLSLMHLADYTEVSARWHYPLKALNIFEVTYWSALVFGIYFLSKKKLKAASYIVLSSYIFLFLCWLVFYMIIY
ncbi:MAG: hypothetical protein AAF616_01940 [Bacteroidota bacterium]